MHETFYPVFVPSKFLLDSFRFMISRPDSSDKIAKEEN